MFDKQTVLDLIKEHGDASQVDQAHQQLPDQVDPQQHADLLQKFGLNPETILKHLGQGGGLGGLLGG